jgi:[ribosomal protein S5]-alanine N-acetyltransferase
MVVAMDQPKQWHTPRLIIRRFREDDLVPLYEMHADPETTKYLDGVWTMDRAQGALGRIMEGNATDDLRWMAVTERESEKFIGVCWLARLGARWEKALGPGHIELGYRYDRRYWGRGYATEAGAAMLRRGFDELNLKQIVAIVDVRNFASERVLQKLGMQYHRTFEQQGLTIKFYTLDATQPVAGISSAPNTPAPPSRGP